MVFGHVLSGADVVRTIENLSVDSKSRPVSDVKITNCGELVLQLKSKCKSTYYDFASAIFIVINFNHSCEKHSSYSLIRRQSFIFLKKIRLSLYSLACFYLFQTYF